MCLGVPDNSPVCDAHLLVLLYSVETGGKFQYYFYSSVCRVIRFDISPIETLLEQWPLLLYMETIRLLSKVGEDELETYSVDEKKIRMTTVRLRNEALVPKS